MKIIFVRHGHPDYKTDALTALGRLHAKAAAERLAPDGIEKIYSSPLTRAIETAQFTASRLGREIEILDCMREISWGSVDGTAIMEKGHPWNTADRFSEAGQSLTDYTWQAKEPWCHNNILEHINRVTDGFDAFMETQGYRREGEFYRVIGENTDKTIAIFGHGGAFTATLAHLMNIPFPLACRAFDLNFTCITVAKFDDLQGVYCTPRFDVIGDARHIMGISVKNTFMA